MRMVNDPKDEAQLNKEIRTEWWKLAGNVVVILGQIAFMALEFFLMCATAVGAIVVGVCRGARHRK
jgi:hypothetical protein